MTTDTTPRTLPPEAWGAPSEQFAQAIAAKQTAPTTLLDIDKMPPLDLIENEPIRAAADAWLAARKRRNELHGTFAELQRAGRAHAEQADARALADALAAGKQDPGARHVADYERQVSEAKRQADAAALIEQDRRRDLHSALDDNITDWVRAVLDDEDVARQRYLDALAEAEQAAHRLSVNRGILDWTEGRRFKTGARRVEDSRLPSDNRRRTADELFAMLRDLDPEPTKGKALPSLGGH